MEASTGSQVTKQKQQALLISTYKQAIALLHRPSTQPKGKQLLLQILQNPDTYETTLRQLRLSTLLSLAQLSRVEGEQCSALYYWHQANKIQSNFSIWVKMAQLLQTLRARILSHNTPQPKLNVGLYEVEQQIQYVYKHAIKEAPTMWRAQLLDRLHGVYVEHGKDLQARDLEDAIRNKQYGVAHSRDMREGAKLGINRQGTQENVVGQWMDQIRIPLYMAMPQEGQNLQTMSPWDYLLAACICFIGQSGSPKKSTKKHEQILTKISKFNQAKTKISLTIKPNSNKQQMQAQGEGKEQGQRMRSNEEDEKLNNLITDHFKEIAKDKEVGSVGQKVKKNMTQVVTSSYSSKTIFESLQDYLREIFIAKSVNPQLLNSFKYVDPPLFQSNSSAFDLVFQPVLKQNKPEKQNAGSIMNQEQGASLGTRERRSTIQITPQQATPGRKHETQPPKRVQLRTKQQREQFQNWLQSAHKFPNIVALSYSLITHIIDTYHRLNIGCQLSLCIQDSRRVTNRLLSQLLCRLLQMTDNGIIEDGEKGRLVYAIMIRYLEEEISHGSGANNTRAINMQGYLINRVMGRIDHIVYSHSQKQQRNYKSIQLQQLMKYTYIGIMLCTMPGIIDEPRLNKLSKFYNKFHELWTRSINTSNQPLYLYGKESLPEPAKLAQFTEARIRKCKIKQLSQQESEESVIIIGQLLKTDMKVSQLIDSIKSIAGMGSASLLLYLKSFAKVMHTLFINLEGQNGFNVKFVQNSIRAMEVPTLIEALHSKLTEDKKASKEDLNEGQMQIQNSQQKSEYNLKVLTLFNLIKVYLLNELDQTHASLCLRIVLYLLEDILKTISRFNAISAQLSIHYINSDRICEMIIFLDSLIKMRESSELRKKFYHRILIKNIKYVYELYNQQAHNNMEIRAPIYKIFNETFHNKHFKPKRLQDCLGYFLMISRQFAAEFDKQEVQFEQKMKRVFGECYLIFKDQFGKCFRECERFSRAMEFFVSGMRKKRKQCDQFVKFFTGKQEICNCCQGPYLQNMINKQPFAKEVFLVVAKFLENKKNYEKNVAICGSKTELLTNEGLKSPKLLNFVELEQDVQKYYLRYFLLAVNKGKAWHQMLRFQIAKVYQHFDAMIGPDPPQNLNEQGLACPEGILELYKHKFKYAKTIGSFIIRQFNSNDFAQAKQYALYRINITNTLKICERKFNKNLTEMQRIPSLINHFTAKYMQGITTVMVRKKQSEDQQFAVGNNLPQAKFLIYTEFMLPFMLYSCQNTHELSENARLMEITIKEGISLIKRLKLSVQNAMVDENQQGRLIKSRHNTKYLDKELRVQIIGALCQMILNILKSVEIVAAGMKKQAVTQDPSFNKYIIQSREINREEEQRKVIQKLDLLNQISKLIMNLEPEFELWRQELGQLNENNEKEQKWIAFDFKDKYMFPDYTLTIKQIQQALSKLIAIFDLISKHGVGIRTRKQNFCRYIFSCNVWSSKIYHQMGCRQLCLNHVKQIANLKNEDLVNFYHHYENEPTEQNYVLAQYFSRDLVFHCLKIDAVQHLLEVYSARPETYQTCIMLIRKLIKMYIFKVELEKDKTKGKTKQDDAKQGETAKKKQKQEEKEQKEPQKEKPSKKSKKQKETKQAKDKANKSQRKIKWIFNLFLKGVELYFESVVKTINVTNVQLDQKYERALVQFKNKVKREAEKQKKKVVNQGEKLYASRLAVDMEAFVQFYENKFCKKIRMKGKKKQKPEVEVGEQNLSIKPADQSLHQNLIEAERKPQDKVTKRQADVKEIENEQNMASDEQVQNQESENGQEQQHGIKQEELIDVQNESQEIMRQENGEDDSDSP